MLVVFFILLKELRPCQSRTSVQVLVAYSYENANIRCMGFDVIHCYNSPLKRGSQYRT